MKDLKRLIGEQLINKHVHFKCECLVKMDFTGIIKDIEMNNNEIIFIVDNKGKLIKIGENHPNMKVEFV